MSTDDQTSNLDQNDDGKSDKIADDDPDIKYNKEFMINFLFNEKLPKLYTDDIPDLEPFEIKISPKVKHEITYDEYNQLLENIFDIMDEYYKGNILEIKNYKFEKNLLKYVSQVMETIYDSILEEYGIDKNYVITEALELFYRINKCKRSYADSIIIKKQTEQFKQKIDYMMERYKEQEQPEQRTRAWYEFRWNLLTASSIWKALDTEASKNNLILGKCVPYVIKEYTVNVNSAFHNGHKYEPLSIMIYENRFDTEVADFGCMKHFEHDFIGASPDGINVKRDNERYGRMLEIKNPVSRKLTGIPKMDYWVQMQIQMEVWNLDECDFYETCFKEYETEEEFYNDGDDFTKTKDGKMKGVIVMFCGGKEPIYKYAPIGLSKEEYDKWYENCLTENKHLTWFKNIFWYLKDESLVLVTRNKLWFENALPAFKNMWETIVKERVEGYEHRRPKKRRLKVVKEPEKISQITFSDSDFSDDESNKVNNNLNKKITKNENKNENKKIINDNNNSTVKNKKIKSNSLFIKVRTQSFEESIKK